MAHHLSMVAICHRIVRAVISEGDIVIDATLGNGHDTLFLAECVGTTGHVYGFDIQPAALTVTQARLAARNIATRATLFQADHAHMAEYLPHTAYQRIRAIMFNLGYLPGSDKRVITRSTSTLTALQTASEWLAPGGIVTIVAYPGHAGGDEETQTVSDWFATQNTAAWVGQTLQPAHTRSRTPRLFWVMRRDTTSSSETVSGN